MSKSQNHERKIKLARQALEVQFRRRAGEAIIAATVPDLIKTVPCDSGIYSEAMVGALR